MFLPGHSSCEAKKGGRLRRSARDVIVIGMPAPEMALSRENDVYRAYVAGRTLLEVIPPSLGIYLSSAPPKYRTLKLSNQG